MVNHTRDVWRCRTFVVENNDLAPHTQQNILTILQEPTKKHIEMAAVVDAGKEFVKSTYKLREMVLWFWAATSAYSQ